MFEMILRNMLHRTSPSTSPRWTAKPMILLENWSIMTMTEYAFRRTDSALKKSMLHRESLLCPMTVSQEGPEVVGFRPTSCLLLRWSICVHQSRIELFLEVSESVAFRNERLAVLVPSKILTKKCYSPTAPTYILTICLVRGTGGRTRSAKFVDSQQLADNRRKVNQEIHPEYL